MAHYTKACNALAGQKDYAMTQNKPKQDATRKTKPNIQHESPYFAAIDLGSNSFHMVVARVTDDKVEIIDREKQMVQIARGLQPSGSLDIESQERAISCLHRFSERLKNIPNSQIRVVGTKTLRSAKNSSKFLKAAELILGVKIQIVSGYEEARLVYAGLANTISKSEQRLVIDIGGGSTEFIIGSGLKPIRLESLPLGCVTYSEKHGFNKEGPTQVTVRSAYYSACNRLEQLRKNFIKTGWQIAYGTSGTMKAVAELLADKDGGAVITRQSLNELIKDTIDQGKIEASNVQKLRKDVLPAGLAILQAIFDQLQLDTIQIADATLKEGLIYDTLGRFCDRDVRIDTVNNLIHQYNIDQDQATRTSRCARDLWSQITGPNLEGISRSKILIWAAQLHEIGLNISHADYHRHGYYLLRHSDLAGFGRYEQYILANLVRLQRKKLSDKRFKDLGSSAREAFEPLLLCLRLAVLLHRRRENIDTEVRLHQNEGIYTLTFDENWLDSHPLTQAGLQQEQEHLSRIGITLSVE